MGAGLASCSRGKVDDEVGGRVEDESEEVEAGQAEDPWGNMAGTNFFSVAGEVVQNDNEWGTTYK